MLVLTELTCRKAPRRDKTYRMSDGNWLYFEVPPKGSKRWVIRYREIYATKKREDGTYKKKDKLLTLGKYPVVGLKEARKERDRQQELHAKGIDPSEQRKIDKNKKIEDIRNTFESIGDAWLNTRKNEVTDRNHKDISRVLRKNLYFYIGDKPIKQITYDDLLEAFRKTESKGHHATVWKMINYASEIYKFGIRRGWVEYDKTVGLKKDLKTPKTEHITSITDTKGVGRLLRDIDTYEERGTPLTCAALRLLPLVFVRPSELCEAEWREINWEEKYWLIGAEKMKMKKDHIVPLSSQALKILLGVHPQLHDTRFELHDIRERWDEILQQWSDVLRQTEDYKYIFPSTRNSEKTMSQRTMNTSLEKLGYKGKHSSHSWRSTARTILDERLGFKDKWIEMQLAHKVKGPLGDAYNRSKYLDERRVMMQEWADKLDEWKADAIAEVNTG